MIAGLARSALALAAAHARWLGSVTTIWRNLLRARRVVDRDYYLAENPDVREMGLPPTLHYALYGEAEHRRPSARVDRPDHAAEPASAARPALHLRRFPNVERFYDDARPAVSIVVLNHGKAELTRQCLDALWEHTSGQRYEIVVIDNGSGPADFAALARCPGRFRLVRLAHNRFFGEGNNVGAEVSRGSLVMFLNNDVVVTAGWLEPLLNTLHDRPDAGAVGATLLNPDGTVQEAGARVGPDGLATQHRRGDAVRALDSRALEVDYCSAAALLVRRDAFERVCGFDLIWEPAFYEDVDLCRKLAAAGWKTLWCPGSRVIHYEHSTTGDSRAGFDGGAAVEINRGKFVARWSGGTADAPRPSAAASPSLLKAGRPRLAIYTPHALIPGGGERYLFTLAEAAARDFSITLVTEAPYSAFRIRQLAREFGLSLDDLPRVTRAELSRYPRFDAFVAMDIAILPAIPSYGTRGYFICQFPFPLSAEELTRRWGNLDGYESIVAYSAYAGRHVTDAVDALALSKRPRVEILAPPVPAIGGSTAPRAPEILSIGRFYTGGHPKRHDAMIEAFRDLHRAHPAARLHLAGALHPEPEHRRYFLALREQAGTLPVTFHPNPSPRVLTELYRRASVYWHATGFGADERRAHEMEHFGIAIVEAMSAGCIPVCFAGGGILEIVEPGKNGFLFRTAAELVQNTLKVLQGPDSPDVATLRTAALASSTAYDRPRFADSVRRLLTAEPRMAG